MQRRSRSGRTESRVWREAVRPARMMQGLARTAPCVRRNRLPVAAELGPNVASVRQLAAPTGACQLSFDLQKRGAATIRLVDKTYLPYDSVPFLCLRHKRPPHTHRTRHIQRYAARGKRMIESGFRGTAPSSEGWALDHRASMRRAGGRRSARTICSAGDARRTRRR